jgi:ubiquinone/menaquinone biosynthesis C-methylase UbiE
MTSVVFDRAADYYDRTRGYPPGVAEQVAALLVRAGGLHAGSRVLELGVGTGRVALPLARHVRELVGVDRSPAMLARLRHKQGAEPIVPLIADGNALPLRDHSCSAAIAVHFFHLVADWQGVLREVARVLEPGSMLLLGEDSQLLPELWDAVHRVVSRPPNIGIERQVVDFPCAAGFALAREPLEIPYRTRVELTTFLREIEERVWSATWRMRDDEHAQLLDVMRGEIVERYGSVDAVTEVERRFRLRCYTPA